jgi:hypothetical protein
VSYQPNVQALEDRCLPAVNLISSFTGLAFPSSGWYPPDTCGAAGPVKYVETVNQNLNITNKDGSSPITDTFGDFWFTQGHLAHASGGSGLSDPIIVWDDQISRFIIGDQDVDFGSHVSTFDVAISKTATPLSVTSADWYFGQVSTTEAGLDADYPGNFGYNHDAFVFTLNMFSGHVVAHVQVDSLKISDLVSGTITGFHNDVAGVSLRPTVMHDSVAGDPMWLLSSTGGAGSTISVYKMTSVLSNAASFTVTAVGVNPYGAINFPLQPDGTDVVTNIDTRILQCAEWNGMLVATHHVGVNANQDDVRWYEFDVSSGSPVLSQQGDVVSPPVSSGTPNVYDYYPGININSVGDIGISYMQSAYYCGAGQFVSMYVTARHASDPAGTMEMPVEVKAGQNNYHVHGRAGDLSGTNVDADGTFWAANSYATAPPVFNWGTEIAHFNPALVRTLVPGVYSTGVDNSHNLLPDASFPGTADPHFTVTNTAGVSEGTETNKNGTFPLLTYGKYLGPWVPEGPAFPGTTSRWVVPADSYSTLFPLTVGDNYPGLYVYQTTFNMTVGARKYDPTTAIISGQWAADDLGIMITLNGHAIPLATQPSFRALVPFSYAASGAGTFFVQGLNTLDFYVINAAIGNPANPTGLRVNNLQVSAYDPSGGLFFDSDTLSNGTVGTAYAQQINVDGGTGASTFTFTGTLPPGLTLSSAGLLSGTPTTAGSYTFNVTATDSLSDMATEAYTVVISPAITITTSTLASWTLNEPFYSQTIATTGGTGPLLFSSSGALPPGLMLSPGGVLYGTPTATGSYPFSVSALDTVGATASQSYTVVINSAVSIGTTSLPSGTVGHSYSQTAGATGGTGSLTYSVTSGTLPIGVTLNSTSGVLSGTPSAAGTYNFTVTASDGLLPTGSFTGLDFPLASQGTTVASGLAGSSIGTISIIGFYFDLLGIHGYVYHGGCFGSVVPPSSWLLIHLNGISVAGSGSSSTTTIVGDYTDNCGEHGFVFNGSTFTTLDDPNTDPTYGFTVATGISGNDIVGYYTDGSGQHGFLYDGSTYTTLDANATTSDEDTGFVTGTTVATGISGSEIVGFYTDDAGVQHGFLYNGTTYSNLDDPAGNPGTTMATGISGSNIVGVYTDGTGQHGFLYNGSTYMTINDPVGNAGSTNLSGISGNVITGSYTDATGQHGFEYNLSSQGASASQNYSVYVSPSAPTRLQLMVPPTSTAGTSFPVTVNATDVFGNIATGYTGLVTLVSSAGADISPTNVTLTNGTATVPVTLTADGSQTITGNAPGLTSDPAGPVAVDPGVFMGFTLSLTGPNNIPAGQSFEICVQAVDAFGNPVAGGFNVDATISPAAASNFPQTVPLGAMGGMGYIVGYINTPGTYTVTVTGGGKTGTFTPLNIVAASAEKLAFTTGPVSTPTGDKLPPVRVAVEDLFGNIVTSDSSDVVNLSVASGPAGFLAGSTTSATVSNGVATFNNLTLVNPGGYSLSALVSGKYISPNSSTFVIAPLQVLPTSFANSPTGFSVQFNAPFLVNSVTPALFGPGFGSTRTVIPTVTLTGPSGPVEGSVVLNTATNSLTFVETDTASQANNGTPALPDGTYHVDITSSGANGLQALNPGGGFLDGTNSGTPGHDFMTTFTVTTNASGADLLWILATADGPKQTLQAPGNNISGGGYPVLIDDHTGSVTSVNVTFNYNPAMLTINNVSSNPNVPGSNFALNTAASSPGHAVLNFTSPPSSAGILAGGNVPLGFINATVPNSSASSPIYKGKDLLSLSSITVNGLGGPIPTVGVGALHVVAFVGDANGDGAYSSGDAVLITRESLQTDTGYAAYPLVDPVIIADTDGSGFTPADASLQVNEVGVGFPASTVPPLPTPVNVTPIGNNVDPSLALPTNLQAANGVVAVPVNLDETRPEGSTGLIRADLALTYNPRMFTVSADDVHAGSVLAGSNWTIVPTIDQATGQIGIALSSSTAITQNLAGSLVTIDFHPIGNVTGTGSIELVASVTPNGRLFTTMLQDAVGQFTLMPAPVNSFDPRLDTAVAFSDSPSPAVVKTPVVTSTETVAVFTPAGESGTVDVTEKSVTVPVAPAAEDEAAIRGAVETETQHVAAVYMAATEGQAVTGLPLAGLLFPIATMPVVNPQRVTVPHVADPLLQNLARTTNTLASTPLDTVFEVYDRILAGQRLLPSTTANSGDRLDWNEMGDNLDVPVAGIAEEHTGRAGRRQRTLTPAVPRPAKTVDPAALDQVFAQADQYDVILDQ